MWKGPLLFIVVVDGVIAEDCEVISAQLGNFGAMISAIKSSFGVVSVWS